MAKNGMKIGLLGDFGGTPDEGMKNISKTVKEKLSGKHEIISMGLKDSLKIGSIKRMEEFCPSIIHYFHGPTIKSLLILKLLKSLLGNKIKIVVSATRPYFSKYSRWMIPYVKPDLIFTQSEKFEKFFIGKGCKVVFLPNGVDCQKFSPVSNDQKMLLRRKFNIAEKLKILLHVGHIKSNRKLEIFEKIQQIDGIQIIIVGGTAQKSDNQIKHELKKSGIRIIHEYIEDISEIYKLADLYVFTIQDTGENMPESYNQVGAIDLPLSVFEAMACNLPVITTRFGALPRLFHESDGFYYASNEGQILSLIENFSFNDSYNTRKKVLPFDWEHIVDSMETQYKRLLD